MSELNKEQKNKIENIAKRIREALKKEYKTDDLKDPFKIISKMQNYIIIRFKNENDIQGFTLKKGNYRCIYINSGDVLGRQYYSCWHEFYHSIDDRNKENLVLSVKNDESSIEKEAEYFASCMLMDKIELDNYIRLNYKNENLLDEIDLIKIQYHFKVSYSALKLKLNEIYNTNKFFSFKINSIENQEKFLRVVESMGYSTELITSTNDFCLPEKFINAFKQNVIDKRIGMEKAKEIIDLLNEKEVKIKW